MAVGPSIITILIIAALVVIPLVLVVIVIAVVLSRRGSQQPFEMPRHCPSCQTSFEPGSAACPQCGYSLDRP